MENKDIPRMTLNAKQKYALCKLMDENRAKYNGMTKSDIASDLRTQVDFDFNANNVDYLAKQIGIEPARKLPTVDAKEQERINKLMVEVIDHLAFKCNVKDGALMNWIAELRRTVFKPKM